MKHTQLLQAVPLFELDYQLKGRSKRFAAHRAAIRDLRDRLLAELAAHRATPIARYFDIPAVAVVRHQEFQSRGPIELLGIAMDTLPTRCVMVSRGDDGRPPKVVSTGATFGEAYEAASFRMSFDVVRRLGQLMVPSFMLDRDLMRFCVVSGGIMTCTYTGSSCEVAELDDADISNAPSPTVPLLRSLTLSDIEDIDLLPLRDSLRSRALEAQRLVREDPTNSELEQINAAVLVSFQDFYRAALAGGAEPEIFGLPWRAGPQKFVAFHSENGRLRWRGAADAANDVAAAEWDATRAFAAAGLIGTNEDDDDDDDVGEHPLVESLLYLRVPGSLRPADFERSVAVRTSRNGSIIASCLESGDVEVIQESGRSSWHKTPGDALTELQREAVQVAAEEEDDEWLQ